MTCVVGIADGKTVWMGADSAGATDWNIRTSLIPKVFKKDGFLIGYTTSFRMGQLLQYSLDTKILAIKLGEYDDPIEFMVDRFVPDIKKLFKDEGFAKIENNVEEGGCFMVGFQGKLFVIHSDYQVQQHADPFESIGCGSEYALGCLYPRSHERHPSEIVRLALITAAYFSNGVQAPFTILSVGEDNEDN